MNHATSTMFMTASGKNTFQPIFIRMSYLSRGIVQRTQTKTNRTKPTLARKATADSRKPISVAGSSYHGTSHPPKKSVTTSADIVVMAMYSDMKNMANFIDEYSVWYPATSSASASAKSNGSRFVSANAETMKTIIESHMAGEKQFHAGIFTVSKRTKVPLCPATTSVSRSEPATISALTAASASASSYEIICAEAPTMHGPATRGPYMTSVGMKNGCPHGTTTIVVSAGMSPNIGAIV